jgi:GDPmannose 4,6-dehydratase
MCIGKGRTAGHRRHSDKPDDIVLATGETRSVHEFVEIAFAQIGRGIE